MTKNKELLRKDVGAFLKEARINRSLTGRQLGKLLSLSQQQISRYERGVSGINIEDLNFILNILGKSWLDLFESVIIHHSDDYAEKIKNERIYFL